MWVNNMIKSKSSRHIINVQHQSLHLLVYICWEIYSYLITNRGFRGGSDGKESACNAGDPGLILGLGISPREGKGYPFQYSDLENSVDRGEEPGWLQSMGLQGVQPNWETNTFTFITNKISRNQFLHICGTQLYILFCLLSFWIILTKYI